MEENKIVVEMDVCSINKTIGNDEIKLWYTPIESISRFCKGIYFDDISIRIEEINDLFGKFNLGYKYKITIEKI